MGRPRLRALDLAVKEISRRELIVGAGLVASGLALGGVLDACATLTQKVAQTSPKPRRGGNFRLGTLGSSKDIMDAQNILASGDTARQMASFETLLQFDTSNKLTSDLGLAESVTQDAPDQWTIRLKQGIEFHDGKTLNADDVVYSLQRILTQNLGLFGYSNLAPSLEPKNIQKMDDRTVRLHLTRGDS